MSLLSEIREKLENQDALAKHQRCTVSEIAALKRCQFVQDIPPMYVDFLEHFGKDTGRAYLQDWYVTYDWLATAKQELISRYYGKFSIPSDIFVFAAAPKFTQFLYFEIDSKNDDPTVYLYDGIKDEKTIYASCLSDFYLSELRRAIPDTGSESA